ncbi:MAG: hypothetical protein HKN50_13850 [Gammaproteobacteria bacterium]|nr:hypothetical protein [Gammaproteobacteria bacterium]
MKDQETEFLNKLFAGQPADDSRSQAGIPLLDVPEHLSDRLYAIPETIEATETSSERLHQRASAAWSSSWSMSWQKVGGIAASLLVAVVVFQVYQQQQTLKQLEQAQADLAVALHYLGQANEITRVHMRKTLNSNIKKAAVEPVVEIGRETVRPSIRALQPKTKTPTRSL